MSPADSPAIREACPWGVSWLPQPLGLIWVAGQAAGTAGQVTAVNKDDAEAARLWEDTLGQSSRGSLTSLPLLCSLGTATSPGG